MRTFKWTAATAASVSAMALALASPARAQQADGAAAVADTAGKADTGTAIGEIIVTAQKRSESAQGVPIAITAVGGDALRSRSINEVLAMSAVVPNVSFGSGLSQARLAIRGIGLDTTNGGFESRAAYHLDGVYISRPEAILGTFYDVGSIEVLRGPQGTLYGRNAVAGTVNVNTRGPTDEFTGFVEATGGNYDLVQVEAGVGGPLAEGLRFRIAGQIAERDGFGKDITTGNEVDDLSTRAIRGKLSIQPTSSLEILLSADYQHEDDNQGSFQFIRNTLPGPAGERPAITLGGVRAPKIRDTASDFDALNRKTLWGTSGEIRWDLGGGINLTSVTAYRHTKALIHWDQDETARADEAFIQGARARQFSQETRLSGEFDWGRALIGAYYFDENQTTALDVTWNREIFGLPALAVQGVQYGGRIKTKAAALFGQATFNISEALSADLGLRYSTEKKTKLNEYFSLDLFTPRDDSQPPQAGGPSDVICPAAIANGLVASGAPCLIPYARTKADAFSPKFTLNFKPLRGVLIYVTYSQAFKSGGFNMGGLQPAFKPEKLTDYEVGVKADWLGGRLRTNLSGFYYRYKNLQVSQVIANIVEVRNAAKAKLYGMEAEIVAIPVDNLQLNVNLGLLHSEYQDFLSADPLNPGLGVQDLSGRRLPEAPPYTLNAGIQYRIETSAGVFTPRFEGVFNGRSYFSPFENKLVSQSPWHEYNAFLEYEHSDGHLYGSLFVRNLTNTTTLAAGLTDNAAFGGQFIGVLRPPRTYGIRAGYRF